ncbi:O-antigen ligase family protein [Maribacter stanieri]|uniref:O-antigen ligase n=1 Tax=Maribacter stanieri TaxID=440514 RepID=A0A1I6JSN9_9FLAO|nr:O-antigen ligase family protein [Maribacter stanieri]SFR81977.1 O-antigen ligase [Maribacter stanieri]|tara:strand:- start:11491 stop:12669 length:1179 start_codon:yes stop_codon:yes gene_type:complete|eukprot:TRINITY_DN16514_c0_g1_i5.p1 TRINITY_DN16514_c0_g1~~TRINITY_DN16514_c0_g1_i5.p1  ORF type:complete len:393 (-),score=45.60 TRINITY_DN16514_c0_g1_i5:830-2008(-)
MKKSKQSKTLLGIFIIFVIVFLNALGPFFQLQQIATMGLLPILAGIAFLYDGKSIHTKNKEFIIFLMILLLSFTTIYYFKGFDEFTTTLSSLFGAVVAAYIAIGLTKKVDFSLFFHIGYIFSILTLFIIMIINGNISANFASAIDFRDRFMLNANAYSYFCIFANFSLFYLYLKFKNKLLFLSTLILPLLFLVIAFTTQSRAGLLLITTINICFWLFINKPINPSKFRKITRKFVIILALIILGFQFLKIYQGSRIQNRVTQTANKKDSREILIEEGIEVFIQNPILGVGLGQFPFYSKYRLFTHNSYTEILAEQGVIGGILLFSFYLIPTFKSIKNYRSDKNNPLYKFYLLFFITFLIYNNFYVFYKFPFSMMYFFLIISLQKNDTITKLN